jgi:hypothetical protein
MQFHFRDFCRNEFFNSHASLHPIACESPLLF